MDRKTFLHLTFQFFRIKDEGNTLLKSYDLALSNCRNVDWDALYMAVIRQAETRYLPLPAWFINKARQYQNYSHNDNTGRPIRVIYNNGRYTDYVTHDIGLTVSQIKEKGHGNWTVKEIRLYPAIVRIKEQNVKVALVGSKVMPEDTPYEIIYIKP